MTIEFIKAQPLKFDAQLDDWTPVIGLSPFDPSRLELRVAGQIVGDKAKRFPDGRRILTSPVLTQSWRILSHSVIRTQNTRYRLLDRSSLNEIWIGIEQQVLGQI